MCKLFSLILFVLAANAPKQGELGRIYIYNGPGVGRLSRAQLEKSIIAAVDNRYAIESLGLADLYHGEWRKDAALLVISGGGLVKYLQLLAITEERLEKAKAELTEAEKTIAAMQAQPIAEEAVVEVAAQAVASSLASITQEQLFQQEEQTRNNIAAAQKRLYDVIHELSDASIAVECYKQITEYVNRGGRYFGCCAGGILGGSTIRLNREKPDSVAASGFKFFPGLVSGPTIHDYVGNTFADVHAVQIEYLQNGTRYTMPIWYQGGCHFVVTREMGTVTTVATYVHEEPKKAQPAIVCINQRIILSCPHIEVDTDTALQDFEALINATQDPRKKAQLESESELIKALIQKTSPHNEQRRAFFASMLKMIGLQLKEPAQTADGPPLTARAPDPQEDDSVQTHHLTVSSASSTLQPHD